MLVPDMLIFFFRVHYCLVNGHYFCPFSFVKVVLANISWLVMKSPVSKWTAVFAMLSCDSISVFTPLVK